MGITLWYKLIGEKNILLEQVYLSFAVKVFFGKTSILLNADTSFFDLPD